jgi:hypothetical protein
LDDRCCALGREAAGRGWSHGGVRDRPAADRQCRAHRLMLAQVATASLRPSAARHRESLGGSHAATRRPRCRRRHDACRAWR